MLKLLKNHTLIFCLFFLSFNSFALVSLNKQWSVYTFTGNYDKFVFNIQPQLRLVDGTGNDFQEFILHAGFGYKILQDLELYLGNSITTRSQDASRGSTDEYRFWEQVIWNKNINTIIFNSRTRYEQRKSLEFIQWGYRLRERLLVSIPLTETFSFELNNEVFIKLNNVPWIDTGTFDQNRAYAGVAKKISRDITIALGYMNQCIYTTPQQSDNVFWLELRVNVPDPTET